MEPEQSAWANGVSPPPVNRHSRTGPENLRATCRRQQAVIDGLSEAVATMCRGAKALKAENAELRADANRLRDYRAYPAHTARSMDDGELVEVTLNLDVTAPGSARTVITKCLGERVAASALDSAHLLISELVSNSLRHSGSVDGRVVISVELAPDWFRVGVLDSGSDSVITVRPPNTETGDGFGLNLVQMLSERWGVEHVSGGGTQVWAQLQRAPAGDLLQ